MSDQYTGTSAEVAEDVDVFETSSLPVPPAVPDAHQATIESVTLKRYDNEKGTVSILFNFKSLNVPSLEMPYEIFLPKGFVEDVYVDAKTLPEEEGNKQQSSFRIGIANGDGTATLQTLKALATAAGRSAAQFGLQKPHSIDEFVANYNTLLTGLEVIVKRRADSGDDVDPRYKNKLKVRDVVAATERDNIKAFKKYTKQWEQG